MVLDVQKEPHAWVCQLNRSRDTRTLAEMLAECIDIPEKEIIQSKDLSFEEMKSNKQQ